MGKGYSIDMRKAAVASVENGKVQSKVADYFGISLKTLSNWLRKSRQTGDLSPAIKSSYKSRKVNRSMLQIQIQREPDSTLSELANQFLTSISNIDYHLRKMKITRKKKTMLYAERNEEKRASFQAELNQLEPSTLILLDESGINTSVYREYARAERGQRVIGNRRGRKYQRVNLLAAKSGKEIIAPLMVTGTVDTKVFESWVKNCLVPELVPGKTILMDNYVIHKSAQTKRLILKAECRILFLPPYSPDLNPIEKIWAILKRHIRTALRTGISLSKAISYAFNHV